MENLYSIENVLPQGEIFETILKYKNIHVERIVSFEPDPGILYDQEQDELVIILEGEAELELKGKRIVLKKGESLFIESHSPHRVLYTQKGTIWLAVHIY
jgi:cupin 2 domain-containing protein